MNKKRFVFLMHLGGNMWQKPKNARGYKKESIDWLYRDYLVTDDATWKTVTDFLPGCKINTLLIDMGEAVELKSHPELAVKGSWSREKFKDELKRLRSIGLEPLPKFNFSACHNAWMKEMMYKIGTAEYDDFCRDVIDEACELFDGPALFHLGLDEEDVGSQVANGHSIVITKSPEQFAEDTGKLFDTCRKNGARPWIWAGTSVFDYYGGKERFVKAVAKDVVLSNYHYGSIHVDADDMYSMPSVLHYKKLEELGYEQIPCASTWVEPTSNLRTMNFAKKHMDDSKLLGFMSAPWHLTIPEMLYGLLHDATCQKLAIEKYYGE
ncbi:MAG: hypothetical protein E7646_07680 [Ruminococcaceae bacterium]|nr:hypothetical protein [Oscillospiraceae bacterium]